VPVRRSWSRKGKSFRETSAMSGDEDVSVARLASVATALEILARKPWQKPLQEGLLEEVAAVGGRGLGVRALGDEERVAEGR